jgi:membrane protease YdiL (CAAX protease family)
MQAADERPLLQRFIEFPLVALVVAIFLYELATTLGFYLGKFVDIGQPGTAAAHIAINVGLLFATYKFAIARLGERPRDDLPAQGSLVNLGKGMLIGAMLFCAVVGIAAALGVYKVVERGNSSGLLLALITSGIMPGFTEELLFRGILFRWIEEFAGSWIALLLTSALFGLVHILNPGATWFSTLAIALEAGLLLGGAYMLARSLWLPIGLHAAWNFTQGGIFGVPVSGNPPNGIIQATLRGPTLLSGGSFGLEASIIAIAVCMVPGAWFIWRAVQEGKMVEPRWVRRRISA